jgi:uncharacterized protein (DUF433 family)
VAELADAQGSGPCGRKVVQVQFLSAALKRHASACLFLLPGSSKQRGRIMDMAAVTRNPKIQGGQPCFTGTRVPVVSLFDHLEGGYTVDGFLEQFPTVKREQVLEVLEESKRHAEAAAAAVAAAQ